MDIHTLSPIPLSALKPGEHATLAQIVSGRALAGRMSSLGLTPGVDIGMLQNYGRGPLLVLVRGMHVALGRQEAGKILVKRNQL